MDDIRKHRRPYLGKHSWLAGQHKVRSEDFSLLLAVCHFLFFPQYTCFSIPSWWLLQTNFFSIISATSEHSGAINDVELTHSCVKTFSSKMSNCFQTFAIWRRCVEELCLPVCSFYTNLNLLNECSIQIECAVARHLPGKRRMFKCPTIFDMGFNLDHNVVFHQASCFCAKTTC